MNEECWELLLDIFLRQIDESGHERVIACVYNILHKTQCTIKIAYHEAEKAFVLYQDSDIAMKVQHDVIHRLSTTARRRNPKAEPRNTRWAARCI